MKQYSPTGRRNDGKPFKRLLDMWDQNGSTSGPTPWQIHFDDMSLWPTHIVKMQSRWRRKQRCWKSSFTENTRKWCFPRQTGVLKRRLFDFCLTVHHQLGKVIQMNQLDATLIYWSTRSAQHVLGLEIDIFWKLTTTNTTINYRSNHPLEHKLAAYRYYNERKFKLPLNKENQLKELTTLLDIARSNNFPHNILISLRQQIKQKIDHTSTPTGPKSNTKWATFIYLSPQIRKITNLFRHTKVKIAFKCNNKISQLMKPNTDNNTAYYNRSGKYKLTCNTCKLAYVGQTSRSLKLCFQEHTRYARYNNPQSAYAQHILHNQHENGPIDHSMTILKPLNDTTLLTPYEQYFIQTLHQDGQLIPEQFAGG